MRKSYVSIILFSIFFISFVSAIPSLQLESESYQAHETLIGTIDGVTSPITKDNLKLFQERRELTVDKEMYQFGDKYYFYMILPDEGNYQLEMLNLVYNTNGTFGQTNIIKSLNVTNVPKEDNKTEIITILPGVVESYDQKVSVYVTNHGTKNVSLNYLQENSSLNPGETRKISLILNKSFDSLEINSYKLFSIPLIYLGQIVENNTSNLTNQTMENLPKINLTSTVESVRIAAIVNKEEFSNFSLINLGSSLENLTIYDENRYLKFNSTTINHFENLSIKEINFSTLFEQSGDYNDSIVILLNNSEIFRIPVEITVFNNENLSQQYLNNISSQQKSCGEIGGKICASDENCDGGYTYSGGLCCLGSCSKVGNNTSSPLNLPIGIIIFLIVAAGVYYFYKRIKNVPKQTPEEKIKQIEEKKK
ncbi:Uncharacterised protein [uncultured archaeon]|nr:Uncharacterised protein [uncultured archaeon]